MSTHIETPDVEEDDIVILSHDERYSPPQKNVKKSPKKDAMGLKRKRSEDQESDFNFSDTSSLFSKSVKGASTNRQIKYNLYTFVKRKPTNEQTNKQTNTQTDQID